jgi:hypothetical protein
MFDILTHKGNYENNTEILPHSSLDGNQQENKQQQILEKVQEKNGPLYTIGGNVN